MSILCVHEGPGQTWKKLQALLEDILLEITLFLGKYPVLFIEAGKRRFEDEKLRLDKRDLR